MFNTNLAGSRVAPGSKGRKQKDLVLRLQNEVIRSSGCPFYAARRWGSGYSMMSINNSVRDGADSMGTRFGNE